MNSGQTLAQKLDRWSEEMLRVIFIYGCCRVIGEILLFVIRKMSERRHFQGKERKLARGRGRVRTHRSRYDVGGLDAGDATSKSGTRRVRKVARKTAVEAPDVPDVEDTCAIG